MSLGAVIQCMEADMFVVPKKTGESVHVALLDGRAFNVPPEGRDLPDDVVSLNAYGLEYCMVKAAATSTAEPQRKKGE